ncbi:putative peroxidase [Trichinella pseudospiralis]
MVDVDMEIKPAQQKLLAIRTLLKAMMRGDEEAWLRNGQHTPFSLQTFLQPDQLDTNFNGALGRAEIQATEDSMLAKEESKSSESECCWSFEEVCKSCRVCMERSGLVIPIKGTPLEI